MKKATFFTAILFCIFYAKADLGGKINSLKSVLISATEDSTIIDVRIKLATLLYPQNKTEVQIHLNEAYELAKESSNPILLGHAYNGKGRFYLKEAQFEKAMEAFLYAEAFYKKGGDKHSLIKVLNHIGTVLLNQGNNYEAIETFKEAFVLIEEQGREDMYQTVLNNLGIAYYNLGNYIQAELYYQQCLDIEKNEDDSTTLSYAYYLNNISEVHMALGEFEQARTKLLQSIKIQKDIGAINTLSLEYNNMGNINLMQGHLDSAVLYLKKALLVGQDFNNQYDIAQTRLLMGKVKLEQKDYQLAMEMAKESRDIADMVGSVSYEIQALVLMSDIAEAQGAFYDAFQYLNRANHLEDSLSSIVNNVSFADLENDFNSGSKLEAYKIDNTTQNTQLPFWKEDWFIIIAFFLLTILLLFVINQVDKKNANKEKESLTNIDYLRSNRILWIVAGVFYSVIPFVLPVDLEIVHDPLLIRYALSIVIFGFYFFTFFSYRVRTNAQLISKVVFLVMMAHHFYLIYANDIAIETVMYTVILLSGLPAIYRSNIQIALVSGLIIIMSVLISLPMVEPLTDPRLFVGVIIAQLVIFNVLATAKGDLAQHLEFSAEVVNQADALVFIVDQRGENVFTSQTIKNVLGHEPSEITGHDWIQKLGIPKNEANRIKNNLIRIAKGIIEHESASYYPIKAKNGQVKWISFREKRINQNRVLVIGMDVTQQKNFQDDLAHSENNFRQINETLSDVFYLFNIKSGEYEYFSPNSSSVLGVSQEYFFERGDYINEYVHKEDRDYVSLAMEKVRNGVPIDIEYRILDQGKTRWIREKSFPVFDEDGKIYKKSGLCQNITARKIADAEIEKLSLIASHTDNFILMINRDNRIEWVNHSFVKLTGYSEHDVIGKLPGEILIGPLTNEDQINDISKAVFERKEQMQCDMITYKKDEEPFYSHLEVTPLLDKNDDLEKYFIIGADITQQRADQEAIEKLSLVASNTSNYVIIAHTDHGIEWVNEAFTTKFGYTLDEVKGRFPSTFLHKPEFLKETAKEINEIVMQRGENFKGEITHLTKEGNEVYANVDITPILNQDGDVEKYFVLGVDITYRKRYEEQIEATNKELKAKEEALAESESNFRELIKSIREVFWLRDVKEKKLLFVSDSYFDVFGKSTASLKEDPRSWSTVIHPDDFDRIRLAYDQKAMQGQFNEDYRIVLEDGTEKWVNSRVFPIYDESGDVIRLSGFTEDISRKKEQDIRIQKIADRLEIVHTIEKTILESESTTEIIYNTLDKTLDKLPILRASLALFYEKEQSFYAYARIKGQEEKSTDKQLFDLKEFGLYQSLKEKKSHLIENLLTKNPRTKTDDILIEQGAKLVMISPLMYRGELLGSLNVCITQEFQEDTAHYKEVTAEVANGLALAIHQSQLKDEVNRTNRMLTASIDYAKMIQQAYIPFDISIPNTIDKNMVINLPKDIVSGDFYWVGEKEDIKIVVLGDCTGHGVPGAFMTIIGIGAINNIVHNKGITDPAEILNQLNLEILSALRTKQNVQLRDGMDVGIFTVNKKTGAAHYAGARRPLTIIREDGSLEHIQATRLSIGDNGEPHGLVYKTELVEVQDGDRYFIYSDGCTDQFGGPRRIKFGSRRLEKTLRETAHLSIDDQEQAIYNAIKEWQGNHYQIDDILLVGFELV